MEGADDDLPPYQVKSNRSISATRIQQTKKGTHLPILLCNICMKFDRCAVSGLVHPLFDGMLWSDWFAFKFHSNEYYSVITWPLPGGDVKINDRVIIESLCLDSIARERARPDELGKAREVTSLIVDKDLKLCLTHVLLIRILLPLQSEIVTFNILEHERRTERVIHWHPPNSVLLQFADL